jgi:hypothetical protein
MPVYNMVAHVIFSIEKRGFAGDNCTAASSPSRPTCVAILHAKGKGGLESPIGVYIKREILKKARTLMQRIFIYDASRSLERKHWR